MNRAFISLVFVASRVKKNNIFVVDFLYWSEKLTIFLYRKTAINSQNKGYCFICVAIPCGYNAERMKTMRTKDNKRTQVLRFRVTPEEKRMIDAIRHIRGDSYSDIIRDNVIYRAKYIRTKIEKQNLKVE